MKKNFLAVIGIFLAVLSPVGAQVLQPVTWTFSLQHVKGGTYEVVAEATIDENWYLYSTEVPEGGPIATSLNIEPSSYYSVSTELTVDPVPVTSFDETFQMELGYFSNSARLSRVVEITGPLPVTVKGFVEFMACDDTRCLPPDQVYFELVAGAPLATTADAPAAESDEPRRGGFLAVFWISFLGGLAALLTPCVFPMIPLTVSFFIRNAGNRAKASRDGLLYGLTIIFSYVVVGLAISLIFGADALRMIATSPIFNVFFFLLLLFFAASFLGAFDLTLPSKWSSSLDKRADKAGGVTGVILMGLTFVLVSFSCTGPIVGTLLVEAAVDGQMLSPAIGMLGFSTALAIPFTLFAIFPTAMKSLPKSGGWMNSVKVVLGFIVMAFSLKFLSIADAVGQWGILTRELYLAIWIAIFLLMSLYLLGIIKFKHDSETKYIGIPRLILALASLAFVFYMIPGLFGAPLKPISSFLPSIVTQDFNLYQSQSIPSLPQNVETFNEASSVKQGPHGLLKFTDYAEGVEAARRAGKPIFLDFTGFACANCRKMESQVWGDNTVREMLANEFIIISLYVDNRQALPESEQYISEVTGRRVRNIGNKWSDFQITHYQINSQPFYVLLNHDEQPLAPTRGFNTDVEAFATWLKGGLDAFKNRR